MVAALQRHLRAAPRQLCRGDLFCVALRPCTSEDGILRSLHGIGASGKLAAESYADPKSKPKPDPNPSPIPICYPEFNPNPEPNPIIRSCHCLHRSL